MEPFVALNLSRLAHETRPRLACIGSRHVFQRVTRVIAIGVIAIIGGCSDKGRANYGMPPVPVLAAKVVQRDVPNQLCEIGTVEAFESIGIKARVGGNLRTVNFKEGDFVTKGQLLFVIDPRPFAATLAQAEADLARDQAN